MLDIFAAENQSLKFAAGEYMTIAFHSYGSGNVYTCSTKRTFDNFDISFSTMTNYAKPGFPENLPAGSFYGSNANMPCFDLH